MKWSSKSGFTIIETMLFLGISGLLIMGVLAGAGTSINTQRYRDSVKSLQSFFQSQYFEVANVANTSSSLNLCGSDSKPRGQSDCVILGRLITSIDGKEIQVKSIVGYQNSSVKTSNDVDALKQYNLQVAPNDINSQSYTVEWGASINSPKSNNSYNFSILIVRSPLSGIVRTFIDNTSGKIIPNQLIDATHLSNKADMCINPNGLVITELELTIAAGSSGSSGVEVLTESNSQC